MIVFCEECGARNILDPEKVKKSAPRCNNCNEVLRLDVGQTIASAVGKQTPVPKNLRMELQFREQTFEISQNRPSVTMGRQGHNNLVVEDNRVSRSHARIVLRQDKFVLIDHSTNGTYVFVKGEKGLNLKQNELPLTGSGIFGLGRKVAPDSPEAIHFNIKSG